ncbi:P-loop containing nucleoside triphosphate hydrolase protein [Butyriboletus roseoflavus]|nr:P-loop containing nucleoside triphosphate hydrolase protein [Butyriboletus roseoflavus]
MKQVEERYNARARKLYPGSLKKGKRPGHAPTAETANPNAEILAPKSREQKEQERKERLVQELAAQSESKVSSKRRKRLEKYIDKKLRQEERMLIFGKLAQTQASISTLELQPSSTLGTGMAVSHRERLDKTEDMDVRRLMDGRTNKRRQRNNFFAVAGSTDTENEDAELDVMGSDAASVDLPNTVTPEQVLVVDMSAGLAAPGKSTQSTVVGGALRRNPDGTSMAPRMIKIKKIGQKASLQRWSKQYTQPDPKPESDSSFDSSDSANDTKGDENDGADSLSGSASDSDSDHKSSSHAETNTPVKRTGFKTWAMKQLSAAKGYVAPIGESPTRAVSIQDTTEQPPPKRRKVVHPPHDAVMRGPLGDDLELPVTALAEYFSRKPQQSSSSSSAEKNANVVSVVRPTDVEEARLMLPITAEEQPIMESILLHPVVIICGETGSGKTTQVPQFLYEAGFGDPDGDKPGIIGVTQPRRVAAISMATRVAHELSLTSSRVSYQIRYDATVSPSTTIKFMTDGILLRELSNDFLLSKYSVIIIDEAHERSMNTDILIGVLSRVLKLREQMWKDKKDGVKPLRLVIMSATLRVSDFAENKLLFPSPPPVISVSARQHPVTIHFNRRTPSDYVKEAIKKTAKIHARLPPGGILIFLTGQNEISGVCRTLEARFSHKAIETRRRTRQLVNPSVFFTDEPSDPPKTVAAAEVVLEAEDVELGVRSPDLALDVDDGVPEEDPEALDSVDEDTVDTEDSDSPMHIVPLYSLLPSDQQMRVFESPPSGYRLVVVSTNVAETSLTIPGIRYVVDCGRAKERRFDAANCIQSFQVNWISKASAAQRAGRAGRTGPGHCYRLYSSALYEHYFEPFSQPEILRMPIEGVVLQMKSMGIDTVVNFPFPTPPDTQALKKAEMVLTHLGAVSSTPLASSVTSEVSIATIGGKITSLGKSMSLFPLSPRYSRMLVTGQQHGCLPYVITIVSIMTVGDPFLHEVGLAEGNDSEDENNVEVEYLKRERVKAKEIRRTRRKAFFETQQVPPMLPWEGQLAIFFGYFQSLARTSSLGVVSSSARSISSDRKEWKRSNNALQLKVLRQLLAAAFIDQVAVRKDLVHKKSASGVQYSTAKGVPYKAMGIQEDVFVHPSSVLSQSSPPDYIVFTEIVRTTKPWLKGVVPPKFNCILFNSPAGLTLINPAWLSTLGKPTLCTFTKPTKNSAGVLMTMPKFGPDQWELPPIKAS